MNSKEEKNKTIIVHLKQRKNKINCLMSIGYTAEKLKYMYDATLREIKNKAEESIDNLKETTSTIRNADKI